MIRFGVAERVAADARARRARCSTRLRLRLAMVQLLDFDRVADGQELIRVETARPVEQHRDARFEVVHLPVPVRRGPPLRVLLGMDASCLCWRFSSTLSSGMTCLAYARHIFQAVGSGKI